MKKFMLGLLAVMMTASLCFPAFADTEDWSPCSITWWHSYKSDGKWYAYTSDQPDDPMVNSHCLSDRDPDGFFDQEFYSASVYFLELGYTYLDIADQTARVRAIADYIKNTYSYDLKREYRQKSTDSNHGMREFWKELLDSAKAGKIHDYSTIYQLMLEGAGIPVSNSVYSRLGNPVFDFNDYAQDLIIYVDGKRYWTSALAYKCLGDDYLLRDNVPEDSNVYGSKFDIYGKCLSPTINPDQEDLDEVANAPIIPPGHLAADGTIN